MLCGSLPYNNSHVYLLLREIKSTNPTIPTFISKEAGDVILKMMTVDPEARITLPEVLQQPWVVKGKPQPVAPAKSP